MVRDSYNESSSANLRHQAQQTLDELCRKAKACGPSNRLNLLFQGHMVIQLLEAGACKRALLGVCSTHTNRKKGINTEHMRDTV